MHATRLITLGLLGQMEAGSGYDILHEIDKRMLAMWTEIKPGSIYNALSTLAKEGLIQEVGKEKEGARPTKTLYSITDKGKEEHQKLQEEAFLAVFPNYSFNLGLVCNIDRHPDEIKAYGEQTIQKITETIKNISEYKYNYNDKSSKTKIPEPNEKKFKKVLDLYKSQIIIHLEAEKKWISMVIENIDMFEIFINDHPLQTKDYN